MQIAVTTLQIVAMLVALCAFPVWAVAAISAIRAWRHRAPGVSLLYLMTHPFAIFNGRAFTVEARPHLQRYGIAAAVFCGIIVIDMVLVVLGNA